MTPEVFANEKGCALLAAIDAGLIPETEAGYDTARFDEFWKLFIANLAEAHKSQRKRRRSLL